MLSIRNLEKHEVERTREIDRSEEIFGIYQFRNNQLNLVPHRESVLGFEQNELKAIISRQIKLIENGGQVFSAFDAEKMIAIASVENKKRGLLLNYCKMDILYVSKLYQGKGVASQLLDACKQAAKNFGAEKLYISATPTKNTVDFYLKRGARLVLELDQVLFAEEPEDIHLELDI
ncbi:GNAT superfamily N-acetyltransferase [Pedobacter sp. AK013]|uniref:GNAT family N-acetyltransferase n=1 Tax=Pedobacter sp. AK013 TaxID=2723071 RepID=UPI00161A6BFD|nr:GNAT family N-acetyltransferase [Pedobacter sp. AK013]MBB6235868.1 GNAT superfamily N-acetyltransferase [Pedobacter sp. AK013]